MWGLVGSLGFIIAVPLVVAVLVGVAIDRSLHTTPLFIFVSLGISFLISSVAIVRKVRAVQSNTRV